MKLIEKISEKFGADKILHFLGGAWLTSMFTPFGWLGILIGITVTYVLSSIKEAYFDTVFDWKDIFAAGIGCGASILIYFLFWIIFL